MTRQECNPTLEKIGAALVELMRDLPFDKITVDQITKKAGTGRVTYFRNFSSKSDLLSYYLLCLYKHYYAEHGHGEGIHEKSRDNLLCLFQFSESIRELHIRITDAGQEAAIFMAYKYSFLEEESGNSEDVIRNALLDYGIFGVIHEWIRMGCDPPAAEMVDRVLSLINLRR